MTSASNWLPILEYSQRHHLSISTIRRRIKSGALSHKMENNRYLILDKSINIEREETTSDEIKKLENINRALTNELHVLREEISELKMLVGLYEGDFPPEIPSIVCENTPC